jgi:RNA polymerase sigma-70 factor (TIGR02960 family)
VVNTDLLGLAREGDSEAFALLVDSYRRELRVHCYRMLGSVQDAEDALQETLLAAWQGLGGYQERASIRTWLYRIATSRCLNARRSARRRPHLAPPPLSFELPPPTRLGEVFWLEPYPDVLLEGLADLQPGPDARYDTTEAISLAFVTALQLLPPRPRAVLVLRDVLGYRTREVAALLDTTEASVTNSLKRARAALRHRLPAGDDRDPAPSPGSDLERQLVHQLTRAYEDGDLRAVVALLTEDVWLAMPPLPFQYQGRDLATRFLEAVAFRAGRSYRVIPTRANRQLALAVYARDHPDQVLRANGLMVLTLAGGRVSALTRFDPGVLARFGFPPAWAHRGAARRIPGAAPRTLDR